MEVIRGIENINHIKEPAAVTIGVFDGVHLGHQTIIKMAVDYAKIIHGKSVVITFEPHPLAIIHPGSEPPLLTATDLKAEYIEKLGIDYMLVIPFTRDTASMEAETFIDDVLIAKLHAVYVVVGEDFSFGRGRRGNVAFLNSYGRPKGLKIVAVPQIKKDDVIISSTEVRERLKVGDIQGVKELTGRYPRYRGIVVHGFGRGGSAIGFPTANIETLHDELLPKDGVYAGYAWLNSSHYPCVVDIGISPTFADVAKTELHVHILGFKKDIYGKRIDIELVDRIRDEMRFGSIDELKSQIQSDIQHAREVLENESC
ncbi:MAG: bifunctional riboflavin kinase/FAD synthetase [Actinomycetota bacterium]|nr:bifunctional riboflavin kinase/FAD synthetase [Actinomycetota bacterium]